jgi:hypothetical protein
MLKDLILLILYHTPEVFLEEQQA